MNMGTVTEHLNFGIKIKILFRTFINKFVKSKNPAKSNYILLLLERSFNKSKTIVKKTMFQRTEFPKHLYRTKSIMNP